MPLSEHRRNRTVLLRLAAGGVKARQVQSSDFRLLGDLTDRFSKLWNSIGPYRRSHSLGYAFHNVVRGSDRVSVDDASAVMEFLETGSGHTKLIYARLWVEAFQLGRMPRDDDIFPPA
jgi:hypothetical protein